MMALKKAKIIKWWGKVFILALLVVFIVRAFFAQSYTVSSPQMETALLYGDRVIVNKLSYGVRLPSTLLSIPFTFDSFLGMKSYSGALQLGYHRWFSSQIPRNDVVLYNNPVETEKPFDKRTLFLSRCVAVPGDTIEVKGADFFINGKQYITSPDLLLPYSFPLLAKDTLLSVFKQMNIVPRNLSVDSVRGYLVQSKYEAFLVNQRLSDSLQIKLNTDENYSYQLLVPSKGMTVNLTDENRMLYASIIKDELGDDVKNGHYIFKNDYYWLLSDNPEEGTDSRIVGFVSEKYIIGRASFIWYSSDENGKRRGSRCFTSVK